MINNLWKQFTWKNKKVWLTIIWVIALPIVLLAMEEWLGGTWIWNWTPQITLRNYLLVAVILSLFFGLSGSLRLTTGISAVLLFVFGTVNHYLLEWRNIPLLPADVLHVKTAISVANNYKLKIDGHMCVGILAFAVVLTVSFLLPKIVLRGKQRILCVLFLLPAIIWGNLLLGSDWFADHQMIPDFFLQARGYEKDGALFDFILNTRYLIVRPPDDYSREETQEIIVESTEEYEEEQKSNDETEAEAVDENTVVLPNIICIMNETFADLSVVGEFTTNEDYLPYWSQLKEKTLHGDLYVSVFGAGTANSEFEFLTGDSMAFLPSGSCAYESYVKNQVPSLISSLKYLGYDCTAFHPYYAQNWDRDRVYPTLGFDRFVSLETLFGEENSKVSEVDTEFQRFEKMAKKKYPDEKVFLRRFASDEFDYNRIFDMFEQRDKEKPFFLFNVTMQNHGGYETKYSNFQQGIYLTGDIEEQYSWTDQYLSCIRYSDDALEKLIAYFQNIEEPTVICLFGDHQPSLEKAFIEKLYGRPMEELTMEEQQNLYRTPFFIWANYDIPTGNIGGISANYLSTILLETLEMPLTEYQQYLSQLHNDVPIINALGHCGANGKWYYNDDEKSPYFEEICDYDIVQYNALFDTDNRLEDLYMLNQ